MFSKVVTSLVETTALVKVQKAVWSAKMVMSKIMKMAAKVPLLMFLDLVCLLNIKRKPNYAFLFNLHLYSCKNCK